jgi:hypothetical protein
MRDEDFEYFVTNFGEATYRAATPATSVEKWRGRLPERLLTYWADEGWSGYANGLFWFVNPDDYEDLVDEWLDGTRLDEVYAFHAIARTAFGELFLFGESTGRSVKTSCSAQAVFVRDLTRKTLQKLDLSRAFIGLGKDACDLKDESGLPLFDRALGSLGALAPDEMYGFEPAVVLGGKMLLEKLRKVKLDQHLTILRQLAAPTMPFSNIDDDRLILTMLC